MSESVSNEWDEEEDDGGDLTAGDLFERLKEAEDPPNVEEGEGYDELIDEEPEDVIAAADDPESTHQHDEVLLDETEALEDLLLSGRTEEMGFLWVDADTGANGTESGDVREKHTVENLDLDFDRIMGERTRPESTEDNQEGKTRDGSPPRPPLPILEEEPEAIDISNADGEQGHGEAPDPSIIEHFLHLIRRLF